MEKKKYIGAMAMFSLNRAIAGVIGYGAAKITSNHTKNKAVSCVSGMAAYVVSETIGDAVISGVQGAVLKKQLEKMEKELEF